MQILNKALDEVRAIAMRAQGPMPGADQPSQLSMFARICGIVDQATADIEKHNKEHDLSGDKLRAAEEYLASLGVSFNPIDVRHLEDWAFVYGDYEGSPCLCTISGITGQFHVEILRSYKFYNKGFSE